MNKTKLIMVALVSLAALLACTADQSSPITGNGAPYYDNLADAQTAAVAKSQNILLDFYTDW